jgi:hypothetical protein
MALQQARPGEPIDVRPLGQAPPQSKTTTLVKTKALEIIRLVIPAGKEIPPHKVPGRGEGWVCTGFRPRALLPPHPSPLHKGEGAGRVGRLSFYPSHERVGR